MKICPACRTTYEDDGLNFCLQDGSVLNFASSMDPTVVMQTPRPEPMAGPVPETRPWGAVDQPAYPVQPARKSSRTWLWVLGIFAVLILLCGGGFAGFLVYVASIANSNTAANKGTASPPSTKANTFTRASPAATSTVESEASEVDLSEWVKEPTEWLESEFAGDEFFMTSKKKGYYYVLVAKNDEASGGTGARVTVRNPDDKEVEMGYGLVFHSDTSPLTNDYAFLIDTKRKKYRVVRHSDTQEKVITAWTSSNLIKDGGQPNVLEARDNGDKVELYINGQLANTFANKEGPKSGVPGLYVGDGAKIGFSKLEVVK